MQILRINGKDASTQVTFSPGPAGNLPLKLGRKPGKQKNRGGSPTSNNGKINWHAGTR
jgi:hypothetical protein